MDLQVKVVEVKVRLTVRVEPGANVEQIIAQWADTGTEVDLYDLPGKVGVATQAVVLDFTEHQEKKEEDDHG